MAENQQEVSYFIMFKPIIYKLLVYCLLFYLAIDGLKGFDESLSVFDDIINRIHAPIIMDVETPVVTQDCQKGYVEINKEFVGNIKPGCICDEKFFNENQCNNVISYASEECTGNISNTETILDTSNRECPSNYFCCYKCHKKISEGKFDKKSIFFNEFFLDRKICILYSTDQSTYTYLNSINYSTCDPENICNLYFCKYENKKENKCPPIYFYLGKEDRILGLADNYLVDNDFDNYGLPKIGMPIINIKLSRNKPCLNNKSKFNWNYPLVVNEDCLHSDRFYEIFYFKYNLLDIIKINNMEDFFNLNFPYYSKFTQDIDWRLYLETPLNRFLIYCISGKNDLFMTAETKEEVKKDKIMRMAELLNIFLEIEQSKAVARTNQVAFMISAVILIIYELLFVALKLTIFFLKKATQNMAEQDPNLRKTGKKFISLLTKNTKFLEFTKAKEENTDDKPKNEDIANNSNTKDLNNDAENKYEINKELIEDSNSKEISANKVERSTSRKKSFAAIFKGIKEKKENQKVDKSKQEDIINKEIKEDKDKLDINKDEEKLDVKTIDRSSDKKFSVKAYDYMKKSKNALFVIVKFLNKISGWVTFVIDWSIFLICLISYAMLISIANRVNNFLTLDCLDYDTGGQLQGFNIIMIGVAFQSYEIMFLVLVRLFLIVISLLYTLCTKGRVTWKEFIATCCDNNEEGEENKEKDQDEENLKKKVNTAELANINKKIFKSDYLKNILMSKKKHDENKKDEK